MSNNVSYFNSKANLTSFKLYMIDSSFNTKLILSYYDNITTILLVFKIVGIRVIIQIVLSIVSQFNLV